jgi:hypothetical protein
MIIGLSVLIQQLPESALRKRKNTYIHPQAESTGRISTNLARTLMQFYAKFGSRVRAQFLGLNVINQQSDNK